MSNRVAFIDFVRGLLNINPLERWSPQQAKQHPFITQTKLNSPFQPPPNLKSSGGNKSPAPGVQQQQQAEALSKQRAQAAQVQAQSAAQTAYANMQMNHYAQASPMGSSASSMYAASSNMYSPSAQQQQQQQQQQQAAPPPYPSSAGGYGQIPQQQQMPMVHPSQQIPSSAGAYPSSSQQNIYLQQATTRAGRQRASTMDQQQGGIPQAIQRVASHLDPNAPIRLQPSPAYYPPPPEGAMDTAGGGQRRQHRGGQRAQGNAREGRNFVQSLEERSMEEGGGGGWR